MTPAMSAEVQTGPHSGRAPGASEHSTTDPQQTRQTPGRPRGFQRKETSVIWAVRSINTQDAGATAPCVPVWY